MLGSIRNFSKTIYAKILLGVIIVPFVFWGMGSVFRGGNTNVVAKINNHKISTKDFMSHINYLNLSNEMIRENISIFDEVMSDLINKKLLLLEMNELNIEISDLSLVEILRKNKKFLDENNKFSRIKYEKYLITNNLSAAMFEEKLRLNEKQKMLFNYISAGTYSPFFMVKDTFNNQNKKISIEMVNLEKTYKNNTSVTEGEILQFIKNNKDKLKGKKISLNIALVDPVSLVSSKDFNQLFFDKIDEIDNEIINGTGFDEIANIYKLKTIFVDSFNKNKKINDLTLSDQTISKIINTDKINEVKLIDNGNEYILFKVNKITESLPNTETNEFKNKIIELIVNESKFETNQLLLKKINTNSFNNNDFVNLAQENNIKIEQLEIKNIRDNDFFIKESINEIFGMPINRYTIATNIKNKNFLIFVKNIKNMRINKNDENYSKLYFETSIKLKNNIYSSYDYYLNDKYKITINQQTVDRLKNYFK